MTNLAFGLKVDDSWILVPLLSETALVETALVLESWKRIVSMRTRVLQRTESGGLIEYDYRETEYEYEQSSSKLLDAEQRFRWF